MLRPARCHRSLYSTSATATLNFLMRSLTLRRTMRFSFNDLAPGMWSSRERWPITIATLAIDDCRIAWSIVNQFGNCQLRMCDALRRHRHPFDCEDLDHVADLHVIVLVERDAALKPGLHFAHIVFEAAERPDPSFVNHHAVA